MTRTADLPNVAQVFAAVLARVPREAHPLLIAIAERLAAERYRGWASDTPNQRHRAGLEACAAREEEIAASAHAVRATSGERFRNASMSVDDVLELRELTALADELTDLARDTGMRSIVMRPARLSAWRDALAYFVESREDAEWAREDDRRSLSAARALLWPLDADTTRVLFPIRIPRTPAVDAVAERFGTTGYVVINPGAAWPNKRWPPERFGSVAAQIQRDLGVRSLVLWGPGEQPLAGAVVDRVGIGIAWHA